MKKLMLSVLLFWTCKNIFAQSLELLPVIITETVQQKKSRETGRNIIVIHKEELQKIPGNSLDELLRFIPGIEVQMRGPAGAQSDFVIRGGTFQQVLVLIDGVRMNEPLTGHFNSYIPVLKEEIQRIEIIKGAAASIFGPDAVGGVIHIITQKNYESKKQQRLLTDVKRGTYGLSHQTITMEHSNKTSALFLGIQKNNVEGQTLRGTKGFIKSDLYSGNFSKKIKGNWNVQVRAALDRRDFNAQNFYTTFISDTAREKVSSTWQQASLTKSTSTADYYFLFGGRQLYDNYVFRPSVAANDNRSRLMNIDIRQVHKLEWQQAKFTSGFQVFNKIIRSNDRGNHTHKHLGIYNSLMHQPLKGLFLTEGVRIDWDQSYKWNFIPQLNISYAIKDIVWRGSIGKGVRDADFTERYNNYNKVLVTSGRIGNPALQAEKSINMEIGTDLFLNQPVQLHATVFRRNQTNMIDWVQTKFENMPRQVNLIATGAYALAQNIANVNTGGAEIDVNGMHKISEKTTLRWNTGLTLVKAVAADDISAIYLSNYANTIWNTNFQISNSMGMFSISTLYKNRPEKTTSVLQADVSKSFGLINVRADKNIWNNKAAIYLQIENLMNIQYADFLGAKMLGRWLMSGIRFNVQRTKEY